MFTDIDRIAELAKEDPKRQFFSIAHLITSEGCMRHFEVFERTPVPGSTASRIEQYETNAEENIQELHQRLKDGKYQAQPLRRVYIPEGRRETETDLDSRPGGQDRAEGDWWTY